MDIEKLRQAAKTIAVGCIEDISIDLHSIIDQGFRDAIDQKIAELSQIENSCELLHPKGWSFLLI